ncbi:PREDICTED: geranylgeranyl transferase type-1 subunit beta [Nicrophorus vespilloides]|uniref:Geranylgeranyl transferase type-1 subunit beta n=1 Tax=Nicrophorus vespilloides TaxID=110193 RepID=A0ABM1MJA8_NICVS|nr:PREDICTED: geranylgeranyl transferase type-1 subunit beta [Nicrophorus vespilloides]
MILFNVKEHVKYNMFVLTHSLPQSVDPIKCTIAFFTLSSLDVLDMMDSIEEKKEHYINWIYRFQIEDENVGGFKNDQCFENDIAKCAHIAGTYSALNNLLILGDDFKRVDRVSIIKSLRQLQLDDGSFIGSKKGTENDMRFVYCAACICYILNDWSGMDVEKAVDYILKSISYDGAIAQGPELESHGGSTYCAVATLFLTKNLDRLSSKQRDNLIRWVVNRQLEGFQGRPNKMWDSCYTFWLGATLKMLDAYEYIDQERLENFVLSTQCYRSGGFGKNSSSDADPMHTYLALSGLSLLKTHKCNEVMPALNITYRAYDHLQNVHEAWRG